MLGVMLESRAVLERKIARAESLVAEGEERLAAQRARMGRSKPVWRSAEQSKRLLGMMEATQFLLIDHLKTLKQELEEAC
jgi:hypothetical protein